MPTKKSSVKEYRVYGPFPVEQRESGTFIAGEGSGFDEIADKYGCYIYARSFGENFVPWYAGRTKRSFRAEIFTLHKQAKLKEVSESFERGSLVVFLIAPIASAGRPNLKYVREMERQLISMCYERNPDLVNIQDLPRTSWGIIGVTVARRGRPDGSAQLMKKMLGLES